LHIITTTTTTDFYPLYLHDALPILIAGSNMNYLRHGLHKRTLVGREEGYVIGDGVNPNGEVNTTRSDLQPFYETPNVLGIYEDRSEEHTSELQSRENLVCRLLLEKK